MIDHLTLTVRDYARSKDFFARALGPLGWGVQMEFEDMCGMGPPGKPELWLKPGEPTSPMHLAFRAPDRAAVDAFHAAALDAGAEDNGAPGLRPDYHPNYYAAFVLDADGHNVEAVIHEPPAAAATIRRSKAPRGARATRGRKAARAPKAAPRGKARPKPTPKRRAR